MSELCRFAEPKSGEKADTETYLNSMRWIVFLGPWKDYRGYRISLGILHNIEPLSTDAMGDTGLFS